MAHDDGLFCMDFGGSIDLATTLQCGQALRWKRTTSLQVPGTLIAFKGVVSSWGIVIGQEEPGSPRLYVQYDSSFVKRERLEKAIREYLAEDDDLCFISRRLGPQTSNGPGRGYGAGLRVLIQEPWECLASYIISANSIPNVARVVSSLSEDTASPVAWVSTLSQA